MHFSTLLLAATAVAAAPFIFPLPNGFPSPNATALEEIYKLAGGTLPNGRLPSNLTKAATATLQLIAANEIFEVAYFTELLYNVTHAVPGYVVADEDFVVRTLTAVVNQEQVHALGANGILQNAQETPIQPCNYTFPVSDFDSAVTLAQTFTDVVLGILPLAQLTFGTDGGDEEALIPIVGAILAQEGEQTGYYRFLQKKVAAAAPLLTHSASARFAYTAISQFFVPGSCPNMDVLGLTAIPALTVETVPTAHNSTQLFSVPGSDVAASNATLVYLTGQNTPVSVPIGNVNTQGGKTYFFADFPFDSGFNRGLTIAALVSGAGRTFDSSRDVAASTLYGPALIEVD